MLPFLQKKNVAGLIMQQRKPDTEGTVEGLDDRAGADLDAHSDALIKSVQAGDVKGVSAALRAAFEAMEAQPHEEADETFADQNIKAAKEQG